MQLEPRNIPNAFVSRHLSYWRATYSTNAINAGIENKTSDTDLRALILMGEKVYDKICDKFGRVFPSSVFRSNGLERNKQGKMVSVNGLAGGSRTSGHTKGEAIDIDGDAPSSFWASVDNNELFHWIRINLQYDQLIAEFESNGKPRWIHVSYRAVGNRQQTLIATKNSAGRTIYPLYSDSLYRKIYKWNREVEFDLEDKFFIPETDYQTSIDEAGDEGLSIEFVGNRNVSEPIEPIEVAPIETVVEPVVEPSLSLGQDGVTSVKFQKDGVEVVIRIEFG